MPDPGIGTAWDMSARDFSKSHLARIHGVCAPEDARVILPLARRVRHSLRCRRIKGISASASCWSPWEPVVKGRDSYEQFVLRRGRGRALVRGHGVPEWAWVRCPEVLQKGLNSQDPGQPCAVRSCSAWNE